jgi:uncharacterized protein
MAGEGRRAKAGAAARCPACGRPGDARYRPFCSALCRDQDLLNWLGGRYAVPAVETEQDDADDDDASPSGQGV